LQCLTLCWKQPISKISLTNHHRLKNYVRSSNYLVPCYKYFLNAPQSLTDMTHETEFLRYRRIFESFESYFKKFLFAHYKIYRINYYPTFAIHKFFFTRAKFISLKLSLLLNLRGNIFNIIDENDQKWMSYKVHSTR